MSAVAEQKQTPVKHPRNPVFSKPLIVRCMVYANKPNEYTAECIDLDIIVRAPTAQEALKSLKQALMGYLAVTAKGETTGLIPRPSPLSHRAKYHFFALRAALNIFAGFDRDFLLSDWALSTSCLT